MRSKGERMDKFTPFMLLAATPVPGAKVNVNRIIEAIIIAVICAMATSYVTTRVLDVRLTNMENTRISDRAAAQKDRDELKSDLKEIKDVVYDHIIYGKKGGAK